MYIIACDANLNTCLSVRKKNYKKQKEQVRGYEIWYEASDEPDWKVWHFSSRSRVPRNFVAASADAQRRQMFFNFPYVEYSIQSTHCIKSLCVMCALGRNRKTKCPKSKLEIKLIKNFYKSGYITTAYFSASFILDFSMKCAWLRTKLVMQGG